MASRLDQMKQDAKAFYDLMFNQCRPGEAIDRYVGETYIQHNPGVGDGKQAFIDYFESSVYTLAYRPSDQDFDGKWRRVRVRTKRKRIAVRTRPGYHAY